MALDTLQLKKDLERAFTSAQAEVLARALQQHVVEDLATRRDLDVVKNELRAEIRTLETGLRGEIKTLETSLRSEIVQSEMSLRGEIKDLRVDIVRWIVGALLINFFGVAGLMIALIKNIH